MRISDWSSDVCSSDLIGVESVILSIPSRYILLVIGVDLRLNFAGHLCLFWEFYRFEEVRVDVGEIHLAHVETRKFVDRKTRTLLFLGLAPRLVDLRAALLLKDPRELRFKAALRSEEHTSELQSLMRISYAVFCLKKKKIIQAHTSY